jgi:hypothetical protein
MYEHRRQRPISPVAFRWRLAQHVAVAVLVVAVSLCIGIAGFVYFDNVPWPDAFLHAAIPMSGMRVIEFPKNSGAKLFVGLYALYSGLIYLVVTGIVFAPVLHRLLHRFHWDEED